MNAPWPLIWTGASFGAATLVALTLRRVTPAPLPRWTQRSPLLTAGAAAMAGPSLWWCWVLGLYVANEVAQELSLLPDRWHGHLMTLAGLTGRLTGRAVEQRALGGAGRGRGPGARSGPSPSRAGL